MPKVYKCLTVALDPALWELAERLQKVINNKLKAQARPELNISGVVGLIVENALLENAEDVQDEYNQVGCYRLAVQLAPVLGPDGLAACGLPEVPHVRRPRYRARTNTNPSA